MSRFVLCTSNTTGELVGMRSIVTRYDAAAAMKSLSVVSMNKIGTTEGTNISCSSIALDAANGEHLSQITFGHQIIGRIGYIKAVSSTGKTLTRGVLRSTMSLETMTS